MLLRSGYSFANQGCDTSAGGPCFFLKSSESFFRELYGYTFHERQGNLLLTRAQSRADTEIQRQELPQQLRWPVTRGLS
jgi:hypothetical protein